MHGAVERKYGLLLFARSDDQIHLRLLAARYARVVEKTFRPKRGRGECRVPSAPAASCAKWQFKMHTSIHSGRTGNHPASPHAMVYGLLRDLAGDRAFLSPSPAAT